jgi:hypothetical protein
MLVNRYYLGFVKFEGVWYEGRHPALIDTTTFEQVQGKHSRPWSRACWDTAVFG